MEMGVLLGKHQCGGDFARARRPPALTGRRAWLQPRAPHLAEPGRARRRGQIARTGARSALPVSRPGRLEGVSRQVPRAARRGPPHRRAGRRSERCTGCMASPAPGGPAQVHDYLAATRIAWRSRMPACAAAMRARCAFGCATTRPAADAR